MSRRSVAVTVAAVAVTGALLGCSTRHGDGGPTAPPSASVTPRASLPPTTVGGYLGAPSPQPWVSPNPVNPPPGVAPPHTVAVGTRTLALHRGADRPLPTTIWYPAAGGAGGEPVPEAPAATGPFAVVLFSHGITGAPRDYQNMLIRWAQAGFVVAAPAYPHTSYGVPEFNPLDVLNQPADASHVVTEVLALNHKPGDLLYGRLDASRVAAAGHSGGGVTTVGLFTSARDVRLRAGIVLAGRGLVTAPFTGPPAALLFVHGEGDRTVPYQDALRTFESVPWSRAMLKVNGGGHVTTGRDFEVITGTTTEFLRWSLYGDAAAKAQIPQRAARGGIATFTDQL